MKVIASLACLCALAASAAPARASERMYDMGPLLAQKDPLASPPPTSFETTISGRAAPTPWTFTGAFGVEAHHQDYTEPSLDVNENGEFWGMTLDGRASYGLFQVRGEARLAWGQMDYTGSGTANNIDDLVFEGRLLFAREFPIGMAGTDALTPYLGFGYRRLTDYFGGTLTTTGAAGYDRISQYYYLPIGVEGRFAVAPRWTVKPTLEYDQLLHGTQDSKLSQAVAGLNDVQNDQNTGWGIRAALMARTEFLDHAVEFGPFVRYWHISQSDTAPVTFAGVVIGGGFEPENHTVEAGLGFKVWF